MENIRHFKEEMVSSYSKLTQISLLIASMAVFVAAPSQAEAASESTLKTSQNVSIPGNPNNVSPFMDEFPRVVRAGGSSARMKLKAGYGFKDPDGAVSGKVSITKDGAIVGYLDDPYVIDSASDQFIPATWLIAGETIALDASSVTGGRRFLGASITYSAVINSPVVNSFVPIPGKYVYNPKLGTLHDYCSYSPDSYFDADFRGPCAKHDMCYEFDANKKSGDAKSRALRACNDRLHDDMNDNCASAYGQWNPLRFRCYQVSNRYWLAVTAKNH